MPRVAAATTGKGNNWGGSEFLGEVHHEGTDGGGDDVAEEDGPEDVLLEHAGIVFIPDQPAADA